MIERYEKQLDFSFKPNGDTISISNILGMLSEPFDQEAVAQKTYDKHHDNPDSEYYKMSVEQIVEKWKEKGKVSMHYGRLNDEYIGKVLEGTEEDIELFILDNDPDSDERLSNQIKSFDNFVENLPEYIHYVCREKTIYLKIGDIYVKGRFDAVFYNSQNNKWIVVDWKTSGTIDTEPTKWTKKLLGPAKVFYDLNWVSYTIQAYFYKMALLESGYLPEGTNPDDIMVSIVNLSGKTFDNGKMYKAYGPAFNYDNELLKKIFEFGIKKYKILNK